MTRTEQQELRASAHAIATQVDGEMVVLQTETGFYYGMREMAADLWVKIAGGTSHADLIAFVRNHYQVDHSSFQNEIDEFLSDLHRRQLIEWKRS